jgi:hemoglobin
LRNSFQMKPDIQNRSDIEKLINTFYEKIREDEHMKRFFGAVDWNHHLPRMIGFWEFILFSTPDAYTGSMMDAHFKIHADHKMEKESFAHWLDTFNKSVDELFEGTKAEDAKNAAAGIGATLKYKILGSSDRGFKVTSINN